MNKQPLVDSVIPYLRLISLSVYRKRPIRFFMPICKSTVWVLNTNCSGQAQITSYLWAISPLHTSPSII